MAYSSSFWTDCETSGDWDVTPSQAGKTLTYNSANTGYLGGSMRFVTNGVSNDFVARKYFLTAATNRILQFWFNLRSATTFSNSVDECILHMCSDIALGTALLDLRIINTGTTTYTVRLVDPVNAFATSVGTTTLNYGEWHKFTVRITDSTYYVYLDDIRAAEVTATGKTSSGLYIKSFGIGDYYSASLTGTYDIDNVQVFNDLITLPTTNLTKEADSYNGTIQRYVLKTNVNKISVVRPLAEGNGDTTNTYAAKSDSVSEAQGYLMKTAVANSDQSIFDMAENFRYTYYRRASITALGQISDSKAVPTARLNLMFYHLNTQSLTSVPCYDTAYAPDGDFDALGALFRAAAKVRNGSWTNTGIDYEGRAKAICIDLLAATNSYGNNQLIVGDDQLGLTRWQNNPSYSALAVFNKARQDVSDYTWLKVYEGTIDLLQKSSLTTGNLATSVRIFPNWCDMDNTGVIYTPAASSQDTNDTYDSVRTIYRLYRASKIADDSRITILMTNYYTSYASPAWNSGAGQIYMEVNHAGTGINGNYQSTIRYACDMFCFYAASDTTQGDNIYNNRVINTYVQHPAGSGWVNNPTTPASGLFSYFGQFVTQLCVELKENLDSTEGSYKSLSSQLFF